MEWRTCPICGKERPSTMYALKLDGTMAEWCKSCREKARKAGLTTPRARRTDWTSGEEEMLLGMVGVGLQEAADRIGRTRGALIRHMQDRPSLGLCAKRGMVSERRKDPASGKG